MSSPRWSHCRRVFIALLVSMPSALIGCGGPNDAASDDPARAGVQLIVVNADVYTADDSAPRADAFAVDDGRFVAVGTEDEVRSLAGASTRVIDAGGNTVLPGLVDGHTHIVMGSMLATGVDLSEIEDKAEWLRIVAEKAQGLEPGEWILGGAWDHNLSDGVLPDKAMLDAVAPENPVLLRDIDGHTAWANSLAIELAGITADTPVPPGVVIMTDPDSDELTGIFKEGASLFDDAPGMAEATDVATGIRAAVRLANSYGITAIHDMSGEHDAFLSVLEDGDLTLRVWQGQLGSRRAASDPQAFYADAAAERERIRGRVAGSGVEAEIGPIFDLGYVKMVVDGVLSTWTALMKEPYTDDPDADPEGFMPREALAPMVAAARANDFPVAVHAIGDDAVAWVLDAFAEAPPGTAGLPDRVEHIEVVTPDDVARFRELGVVASMQPHHATCCVGNYVIDRIGRERLPNAYAWRSMLDAGVELVLGSDWPTSPLNPLVQIADTIHRETRIDGAERPWDEGQTLTFTEALTAYTATSAGVTAWHDDIGSITAGKWADFVILDERLAEPVGRSIEERTVTGTWLAGRQVYPRP